MIRVASIGECMVELTLPRGGGDAGRIAFAGDTFNAAVYLRRAAAPHVSVAYVTALGTDSLSDRMVDVFAAEGLDTSLVERRADRAPGLYAIDVDAAGERSFTYWRETSAARTLFALPATVTPDRLVGFDLIYLSGITLAILPQETRDALRDFLRSFRLAGGRIAFDSNYRPRLWPDVETARREIAALLVMTDIALPSLDDEMALWDLTDADAVLRRLHSAGIVRGALKRGPEGPLPLGACGILPDFIEAVRVVDTTAAGDSFNGAYLAALLADRPEAECLAAGHAMAAEVIGHPGAIMPR